MVLTFSGISGTEENGAVCNARTRFDRADTSLTIITEVRCDGPSKWMGALSKAKQRSGPAPTNYYLGR